jgi:hypothetical protein
MIKKILIFSVLFLFFLPATLTIASPSWWDTNYLYKRQGYYLNNIATDSWFPILINMTSLTHFNSDLSDFRMVNSAENGAYAYNYEYKDGTGTYAYFSSRLNSAANSNTSFYIYYGYTSAVNNSQPSNIWNVSAHYTLDQSPAIDDTTVNNLTTYGSPTFVTNATCQFGNCYASPFDYQNYLTTPSPSIVGSATAITVSAWIYPVAMGDGEYMVLSVCTSLSHCSNEQTTLLMISPYQNKLRCEWNFDQSNLYTIKNDAWSFITCMSNSTGIYGYINGTYDGETTSANTANSGPSYLLVGTARNDTSGANWNGFIGPITVINSSLTDNQIMAEYQTYNMSNYGIGAEQVYTYISVTFNYTSINFGTLSSPSANNSALNNYNVTIDTNANYNVSASGTNFDDGSGHTFPIGNLRMWANNSASLSLDNSIALSSTPQLINTFTPSDTTNYHGFWLSIPSSQFGGIYTSTATITYTTVT